MRVLKVSRDIGLIMGSIASIQSLFMVFYLFFSKKRDHKNIMLIIFFSVITLRIVKSMLWLYFDDVPHYVLNLGYASHLVSGPALFLYLKIYILKKHWNNTNYLHFLPAFALCFFLTKLNSENFWYIGGYSILLYHQLIYTVLCIAILLYSYYNRKKQCVAFSLKEWLWLFLLVIGASVIQLSYFTNYILKMVPYETGPVLYAIFIYILTLYTVINQKVINKSIILNENIDITKKEPSTDSLIKENKYKNSPLNIDGVSDTIQMIETFFNTSNLYLNPDFSLSELSTQLNTPKHHLSQVINIGMDTTFYDIVNAKRIESAISLLNSNKVSNITFEALGYDVGYNSKSSFYHHFKRHTGKTPRQYKLEFCSD